MKRVKAALILAGSLSLGTAVFAALLGVTNFVNSAYPRTDAVASNGAVNFDAVSRILSITIADGSGSSPFSTRWNPLAGAETFPHLTSPTPNKLSIYLKINDTAGLDFSGCVTVPAACLGSVPGGTAADFVLTGSYDINGNGNALDIYENGVLLTGSVTQFGFLNPPAQTQDRLDFHFAPTGGLWVDNGWYQGKDIGVVDTLETNTWPAVATGVNSFTYSFQASSKLSVLPVDCNGTIGDFVWDDSGNRNGLQDPGEPGINGVTVKLYQGSATSGTPFKTATTVNSGNAPGFYKFAGLCQGNYNVVVDAPPTGFDRTVIEVGTDRGTDSNNPSGAPVTLGVTPATYSNQTIDFGFESCMGSIGDFVWHDLNRNGLQDLPIEPGLGNVTVKLEDQNGTFIRNTTTAGDGSYRFTGLCAGTYQIEVDQTTLPGAPGDFTPTSTNGGGNPAVDSNPSPATVTLPTDASSDSTIDFGYLGKCEGTVGDLVWFDDNHDGIQDPDELGIDGLVVTLNPGNRTTTTGTNGGVTHGYYQFTGLCTGTYSVTVAAPAGFTETASAMGGNTALDSNAQPASVTLPWDSSVDSTIDFGLTSCSGTIGDYVWQDLNLNGIQDANEPGFMGVTVNLRRASDNTIIQTAMTDNIGGYTFSGICPGDYKVEAEPPVGTDASPLSPPAAGTPQTDSNQNPSPVSLTLAHQSDDTIDFGFRGKGSIGNFVWSDDNGNGIQDVGELGVPGIAVTLAGPNGTTTVNTDANGLYQFTGLVAGTYTVTWTAANFDGTLLNQGGNVALDSNGSPSLSSGTGTSTVVLATNTSSDQTIDFGLISNRASGSGFIGNFVWYDVNNNGIQDAGEPGIAGVTLSLTGPGGSRTTTTDASGGYHFSNLTKGSYTVSVATPAGYVPVATLAGANRGADSNVSGGTVVLQFDFSSDDTIDFGFTGTGTIGNFVWLDANGDGLQTGESATGINGVTVVLNGPGGSRTTTTSTMSGVAGSYQFGNLVAGTYTVTVPTAPAGFVATQGLAGGGANPATDSNGSPATVTIAAGGSDQTIDFGFKTGALPLTLACPPVKTGSTGTAFSSGFQVTGGTPAFSYSIASGSLPPGLTLNTSTGAITGTPTTAGTFTFTGKVVDSLGQTATSTCTASGCTPTTSNAASCTITITTSDFPCVGGTFVMSGGNDPTSGTAGNIKTFTVSGGTSVHVSAFGQNKTTNVFTPAYVGSYSPGLGVTDSSEGTGANNLHTLGDNSQNDYLLFEFDRKIVVDKITLGYIVTDSDMTVWIGNAPANVNPFTTHQTLSAAFLSSLGFTEVNSATATSGTRVADVNAGGAMGNILVVAGKIGDKDDMFKVSQITIGCPAPLGLTCAANAATVSVPYSSAIVASGGTAPYTYSIASGSLPPGLTLNGSTGAITGTPTTAGSYAYTAKVVDVRNNAAGTLTSSCAITVTAGTPAVTIVKKTNGTDNNSAPGPIVAIGSTVTWSYLVTNTGNVALSSVTVTDNKISGTICTVATLAPGASTTCTKTGIAVAGQYTNIGTVTATGAGKTVTATNPDNYTGFSVSCPNTPGKRRSSYSSSFTANGGHGTSRTFSIASGALPAGLTLNATSGAITGTPTSSGTYSFTVKAVDLDSHSTTTSGSIVVQ